MEIRILEIGETDIIRNFPAELTELSGVRKANKSLKIAVICLSVVLIGGVVYYLVRLNNQRKKDNLK
jgi:hypothetical protein